jgi:hypothetical protein
LHSGEKKVTFHFRQNLYQVSCLVARIVTESVLGFNKKLLKVIYLQEQVTKNLLVLKVVGESFISLHSGENSYPKST